MLTPLLDNTMEVTLQKRLNGLGFSFLMAELDTSRDCGTVVRVKTLFPGQAAEESGLIQEGDVILAVDGESLKGLSYQVTSPGISGALSPGPGDPPSPGELRCNRLDFNAHMQPEKMELNSTGGRSPGPGSRQTEERKISPQLTL